MQRLFPIRECDDPIFNLGRPCLYHQMGRCTAPCVGGEGAALYDLVVEQVREFLTGQDETALETVEEAMNAAAAVRDYESAGWYRDQLHRLQRTLGRQRQIASAIHDHHTVLVEALAGEEGGAQLFLIRYGRLDNRVDVPPDISPEALRDILAEPFDTSLAPPDQFERADVDEIRILAHWMRLHEDGGRQVRWTPGMDLDVFIGEVMNAIATVTPDRAEPVEED